MNFKSSFQALDKHLAKYRKWLNIILLGSWALLQYRLGNELYAVCVVLLFLIFSAPRFRNFTLIAIFALAILVFKMPTVDTLVDIKQANLNTYETFKTSLNTILTPNTGSEVLPKSVRQMLELIKVHSIPDYQLSASMVEDVFIYQRMTEAAWPVKQEKTSHYLFLFTNEKNNYPTCEKIERRENIIIAYCP